MIHISNIILLIAMMKGVQSERKAGCMFRPSKPSELVATKVKVKSTVSFPYRSDLNETLNLAVLIRMESNRESKLFTLYLDKWH